jgi:hypothetical protein
MSVQTSGPFEIIDKRSKNGALAQAAQRIRDKKYPDFAIEEVCWEIFVSKAFNMSPSTCSGTLTHFLIGESSIGTSWCQVG